MLWNRANPVLHKHQIQVGVHLSADEIDIQHFRALQQLGAPQEAFLNRFGINGLPRVKALVSASDNKDSKPQLIEGEYKDVTSE